MSPQRRCRPGEAEAAPRRREAAQPRPEPWVRGAAPGGAGGAGRDPQHRPPAAAPAPPPRSGLASAPHAGRAPPLIGWPLPAAGRTAHAPAGRGASSPTRQGGPGARPAQRSVSGHFPGTRSAGAARHAEQARRLPLAAH